MNSEDRNKIALLIIIILLTLFWLQAVKVTEILTKPKWKALWYLLRHTHEKPILLISAIGRFGSGSFSDLAYKSSIQIRI